jgi:hypothetical protein
LNYSLFTINGFQMNSRKDSDPKTFTEDGFVVWGWMMTQARWPIVKDEFTWFGNWDHQMQKIRQDHQWKSLTPELSRTKHIGMKGINFNVESDDSVWSRVYIEKQHKSIDYSDSNIKPIIKSSNL